MALITWNQNYNVNINEIDRQHQMLVKMINDLYLAMQTAKEKETLSKMLDKLFIYAAMHFAKEEHYFDTFGFPETEKHKKEHVDFERKLSKFEKDFNSGKVMLTEKVIQYLANWLVHHIQGSDRRYSKFLTERGVK